MRIAGVIYLATALVSGASVSFGNELCERGYGSGINNIDGTGECTSGTNRFGDGMAPARLLLEKGLDGKSFVRAGSLMVEYDGAVPVCYSVGLDRLLVSDEDFPAPVVFDSWNPQDSVRATAKMIGIELMDAMTVRSQLEFDEWRISFYLQLFPDHLAVRRWMSFESLCSERRKFSLAASFSAGKMKCLDGRGQYLISGMFPRCVRARSEWQEGITKEGRWNDISPIAADNGDGWYCLALIDCIQPYSDRGRVLAHERSNGLGFTYRFEGAGYAYPGKLQYQGDAWLMFGKGSVFDAVKSVQHWHQLAGHNVPAGRPESVKKMILYSTHPRGNAAEYRQSETRGFKGMTEDLPYLKALGINTVWIRPVEDKGIYNPADLYRLQKGVGTEADHLEFVRAAHALGMKVWRDAVPHGGSVYCERSRKHPEWICRKPDGSFADSYWAYDFNWPTWVTAFGEYITWSTRKYELDGWRMDVPMGSRFPNWNPDIPYARASYSQVQGGISQMKSIRAAARSVSPNAITLAEANSTWVASFADAIYDQNLCHWIFRRLNDMDPQAAVRALNQWLEVQRLTYMSDTVWMRYPESHDSYLAANVWGRAAADALMALCAWIGGVPMVCNGSEDMAFETYRRILHIRKSVPELSEGVSYSAVQAPDGVFACLRKGKSGASVVLVNFNPCHIAGEIRSGNSSFVADMKPYGYEVRRIDGKPLAELIGTSTERFRPPVVSGPETCIAELRALDGKPVKGNWRIKEERTEQGIRYRVEDFAGLNPATVRLVIRLPKAEGWFAHSAEGDFQGPYHLRYPEMGEGTAWKAQYGFVRWSSALHPFGLASDHAMVGGYRQDRAWRFSSFADCARIEILDRVGTDNGVIISVSGLKEDAFVAEMENVPDVVALKEQGPGTGDERLKYIAGGWLWDDGALRVRMLRNGALVGVWRRVGDEWVKSLSSLGVRYRANTPPSYIGWNGVDKAEWLQATDPYCQACIRWCQDGAVYLSFCGDRLRNNEIYRDMPDGRVAYRANYVFGKKIGRFSGEISIETESTFDAGAGELGVRGEFADDSASRSYVPTVRAGGAVSPVVRMSGPTVDWLWHEAGRGRFARGVRNSCSIRFGEGSGATLDCAAQPDVSDGRVEAACSTHHP